MAITAKLGTVVLDVPDVDRLATFYSELTGWEVVNRDDDWITLRTGEQGPKLALQLAPDHVAPDWPGQQRPQQFHLDLQVADHQAAAERAVGLGARRLADGATWITLADPAGHPFDLCQADDVEQGMRLFAATIDAPDTSALARFYADLAGMEVTYDGPEGAMVSGDGGSLMFQKVEHYTPPQWPDPQHPQQVHLDLYLDDLDAGEARALELGATRLPNSDADFRVFADPAGHPFCLCLT